MRNVSDKSCTENQNTHFIFNDLLSKRSAFYEIMWKNLVQPDSPQMITRWMRIAYWITMGTNTNSECVISIAFYQCNNIFTNGSWCYVTHTQGADKSLAQPRRKQTRKHIRDARDFNNIERQAVINFLFLQGKAPKEIQAILTKTLVCFFPGRAKDLSAPMYVGWLVHFSHEGWFFGFKYYLDDLQAMFHVDITFIIPPVWDVLHTSHCAGLKANLVLLAFNQLILQILFL